MPGEIMNMQTIEIAGQRFVVLPEPDFRELERLALANSRQSPAPNPEKPKFDPVTPFEIRGESASEMLIRERR